MRLLFIGDIIGRPGRELLRKGLKGLVNHHGVDFVIANAENSAAGWALFAVLGLVFAFAALAQRVRRQRAP